MGTWLLIHPTTPTFHLSSTHFLTTLQTHLDLLHPIIAHFSHCQRGLAIDGLGVHLFWCLCMGEHTASHNILQDTVTTITLENVAHIQREVSHLLSATLESIFQYCHS